MTGDDADIVILGFNGHKRLVPQLLRQPLQ